MIRLTPPVPVTLHGDLTLDESLENQWKLIPYAANSQAIADEAKKTLSLFKSPELSKPSILAQLPATANNNMTIQIIDNAFITAIENYRTELIDATAKDFATAMNPRDTALDFHNALATGAARFAKKTPNIPVLKFIIGPLLSLIGTLYGMTHRKSITAEIIAVERSENRNRWFEEVQTKEKLRLQNALNLINKRVKTLKKDLDDMGDIVDEHKVDELKLLDIFVQNIFPQTTLEIDNRPLLEYLSDLRE
jgi:hypothetical protein